MMDWVIVLVWRWDTCPQIQSRNSRKRPPQTLLERIGSENITSVFHGIVANASRGTQAVPQGLIPELTGEVGHEKGRELFGGRSPHRKQVVSAA